MWLRYTLCVALLMSGLVLYAVQEQECLYKSYQYERSQKYAEAITALKGLPSSYLVELRSGWLYYLKGDYAQAVPRYQAAIKLKPASIEARLGAMLPLLAQRRYADVEKLTRQVLAVDGNNYYANLRLAYVLRLQKKSDQAITLLNRMLLLYPTDASLLTEQGLALQARGQKEAAKRVFSTILLLDPTNATAKAQTGG